MVIDRRSALHTVRGPAWTSRRPTSAGLSQFVRLGLYADVLDSGERPFGEQTRLFTDLARIGREMGVEVVVLSPGYAATHTGWRWEGTSGHGWVRAVLSVPDVVIRRSGAFRAAPEQVVVRDLALFKRCGRLHSLPRRCSNKWFLHRLFQSVPNLRGSLPDCALASGARDLVQFLKRYGDIYLKPLAGAQGVSVYRLRTRGDALLAAWDERIVPRRTEQWRPVFQPESRTVERLLSGPGDVAAFWEWVHLRRALLQESIPLPRTGDGRPFDFRWLVQFGGEPAVIARVARVGRVDAVTTNIHTGAEAVDAPGLLAGLAEWQDTGVIDRLDELALTAARTLADRFGPYAEVGVDLALRPDGRPVLFEVNPTPGRRMLRSLPGNVREISLRRLLEYAIKATSLDA
ncbi:MAG: YheC/YheD family protein [Alicyclobacillus sp.]|nr:YheC/YheD family protein [Alicyclobacillus sp.]